jgi:hypothetical protein
MMFLLSDFEAIWAIASGLGPMNLTLAWAQEMANSWFSDRKP